VLGSPGRNGRVWPCAHSRKPPVIGRQRMAALATRHVKVTLVSCPGDTAKRSEAPNAPSWTAACRDRPEAGAPAYRATVTERQPVRDRMLDVHYFAGPPGALLSAAALLELRDRGIELRQPELPPVRIIRREHVLRLS